MTEPTQNPNTDAIDVDIEFEEDEAAAMAAAMGFSGFGKAPATKKRKYNSKTDAFIEGDELKNVDRGGRKGQGSGGNEVPLGRMRVLGEKEEGGTRGLGGAPAANEEEIDLDMGMEDEDDRPMEERCIDTSRPPPVEEKAANDARRAAKRKVVNEDEIMLDVDEDEDEPATTQAEESADREATEAQKKIDAILASQSEENAAPTPSPKQKQKQKAKPAQGLAAFISALQTPVFKPASIPPPPATAATASAIPLAPGTSSLPSRPPPSSVAAPPSTNAPSSGGAMAGNQRGRRGQRNELWYVDYYDPSFNVNPWRQLEKDHGLPEVGTWVERPPRNQGHG